MREGATGSAPSHEMMIRHNDEMIGSLLFLSLGFQWWFLAQKSFCRLRALMSLWNNNQKPQSHDEFWATSLVVETMIHYTPCSFFSSRRSLPNETGFCSGWFLLAYCCCCCLNPGWTWPKALVIIISIMIWTAVKFNHHSRIMNGSTHGTHTSSNRLVNYC